MSKLTKKMFCEIIERLRDASDLQDKVNALFRESRENVELDFMNAAALQISHESSVVKLLEVLMDDVDDIYGSNISYFIYELDYGRKYEPGMITDENNKEIDLSTAEKLYDYLVQCNTEE